MVCRSSGAGALAAATPATTAVLPIRVSLSLVRAKAASLANLAQLTTTDAPT